MTYTIVSSWTCSNECPLPNAIDNFQCGTCADLSLSGIPLRTTQVCTTGCTAINSGICETRGSAECKFVRENTCLPSNTYPFHYDVGSYWYCDNLCYSI